MIDYKALYLKAALRAGFILLCMFAVITAILVICAWLPSFISGKIGRRALADPEPWAERSGRRRKTRMEQIEWIILQNNTADSFRSLKQNPKKSYIYSKMTPQKLKNIFYRMFWKN